MPKFPLFVIIPRGQPTKTNKRHPKGIAYFLYISTLAETLFGVMVILGFDINFNVQSKFST